MQKKLEVKSLLELSNHHATFAINQALKTEGVIDLNYDEAIELFVQRMSENGGYGWEQSGFRPSATSITTDFIPIVFHYIDFQNWRQNFHYELRYLQDALQVTRAESDVTEVPTGGYVYITITTEENEVFQLAPKKMVGPSLIVVAYVDERPFTPLLPTHAFPVVSIEELKW